VRKSLKGGRRGSKTHFQPPPVHDNEANGHWDEKYDKVLVVGIFGESVDEL
jgi:hypothetical protein